MTRTPTLRALAPEHVVIDNIFFDPNDSFGPHVLFVAERDGDEVDSIRISVAGSVRKFFSLQGVTQWGADLHVSPNKKILVAVKVNDDHEGYSIICDRTSIPTGTTIRLVRSEGTS